MVAHLLTCCIEFKEIRKEWKARKKEEEQQRKAAEEQERQRHVQAAAQAQNGGTDPQGTEAGQPPSSYASRQLPPIAYAPGPQYPPSTGTVPQQPLTQYSNGGHMYTENYQPGPQYGGQGGQMYNRE